MQIELSCSEHKLGESLMQAESRFSDALSKSSARLENQPLWHGRHSVVVPTVGMIVPNWFLIVPQVHTLNFAQQCAEAREEIAFLAWTISRTLGSADHELLVFEHGAHVAGSKVGCGVDHAHTHVVVAPSALVDSVWAGMKDDLEAVPQELDLEDLHRDVDPGQPYYLAWRRGLRILEQPARREVSQRFRRIVAAAAGTPDEWNYREHPFRDKIASTVATVLQRTALAA
jgi:diadenosine tetraphosphate (Ap4A) HIT family hydrolase